MQFLKKLLSPFIYSFHTHTNLKETKQSRNWPRLHICTRTFTGDLGAGGMTDLVSRYRFIITTFTVVCVCAVASRLSASVHVNTWCRKSLDVMSWTLVAARENCLRWDHFDNGHLDDIHDSRHAQRSFSRTSSTSPE